VLAERFDTLTSVIFNRKKCSLHMECKIKNARWAVNYWLSPSSILISCSWTITCSETFCHRYLISAFIGFYLCNLNFCLAGDKVKSFTEAAKAN